MSGQISTAACLPFAGCTKYASHVPSDVLISTSRPFVAGAAIAGSVAATPAPTASAPNLRRDMPRRCCANPPKSSCSHMLSSPSAFQGGEIDDHGLAASVPSSRGRNADLEHLPDLRRGLQHFDEGALARHGRGEVDVAAAVHVDVEHELQACIFTALHGVVDLVGEERDVMQPELLARDRIAIRRGRVVGLLDELDLDVAAIRKGEI